VAVAVAGQPPKLRMPVLGHCAPANIAAHRQKKTRAGSFTNRIMPQQRTIHLAKRVIKQNSIRLGRGWPLLGQSRALERKEFL